MDSGSKHIDEILVVLKPRLSGSGVDRYDAKIYAAPDVRLPVVTPGNGDPMEGMPLRSVETVKVGWAAYPQYLEMVHEGQETAQLVRERLFEQVSDGLRALLEASVGTSHRRIWWCCESPEIEELPWELLASRPAANVFFVRGAPAPQRALIPRRSATLRLAVIAQRASDVAELGLDKPMADVEVAWVSGERPVHEALTEATREGVELVHIVADGSTLPSWDSMLEFDNHETLTPAELRQRLYGSRVVAVGLSPVRKLRVSARGPFAYRAFCHVPSAMDATNIVAQIGPWSHESRAIFAELYANIAASGSVEAAVQDVRVRFHGAPLALYLRQRLGQELTMRSAARGAWATRDEEQGAEPQQMQTRVDMTRHLLEQLRSVERRYPMLDAPLSHSAAFAKQKQEVEQLNDELSPWRTLEDDKP